MKQENRPQAFISISADAAAAGRRLDLFLAEKRADLSRSRIQKLVETGFVAVNKEPCRDKNYRLQPDDQVTVTVPAPVSSSIGPEQIRLDIIYEDEDLLVVNKPRGMVVHPAPGHAQGTLVNALLSHCSDLSGIGGVMRPGIVHRLDKDTSGLLIVAKNDFTHHSLSAQLKSRQLRREYLALVFGFVKPQQGRIEAPIGRHPRHRKKMAVIAGGRSAVTRYRVLKYYDHYSLLRLKLETGRTHQIRVHLAHIGYPVVGDPVYSRSSAGDLPLHLAQPQALHALRLSFSHPRSGNALEFSAPLPEAFIKTLIWLKNKI
jgi:23S rRNA pseudouridine1911/1915/1917 synthase